MKAAHGPLILVLVLLLVTASSALFQVQESERAIVIQLGESIGEPLEPGLHLKIPFIQKAHLFEKRLLNIELHRVPVITADGQSLLLSCYAKWRIDDPLIFFQRMHDQTVAQQRLDDLINAELSLTFGQQQLSDMLSNARITILGEMMKRCRQAVMGDGMAIANIQIRNIVLPPENQEAVFTRMRAEFAARAQKLRSMGLETTMRLKAKVDRQKTEILAQAKFRGQQIRGQADAEASRIYAAAYARDMDFFDLTQSLTVSRQVLDGNSVLLLTPDHELLRYFKDSGGKNGQEK
jgi:membrane protease subunit HflC